MKDRITELQKRKRDKLKAYNGISANSWKKKLYRLQLDIIEKQIQIERLRRQFN